MVVGSQIMGKGYAEGPAAEEAEAARERGEHLAVDERPPPRRMVWGCTTERPESARHRRGRRGRPGRALRIGPGVGDPRRARDAGVTQNPYDRPSDPAKRHSRGADRRPRPGAGAGDAEGDRLHRRRPGPADRRRRDDLDRDHAVQLQPARAGAARQGRDPRGGRDADGVQHRFGLRRGLDGHRGDEGVADLARGDHRLDRARRPRPPVRRPGLHRRLRQDDPGRSDGAVPARHPRARALQRLDRAGHVPGPRHHDPGRLRGGRRARRRARSTARSCTRSSRPPAPGRARAAASSPRTRCRPRSSSSGSARPA